MGKRIIAYILAAMVVLTVSGCKPKDDAINVSAPKAGSTSFKLNPEKKADAEQYIANLQAALNKASSKSLESFISVKNDQQQSMLGYIDSKELKNMFKFYMSNVTLTYETSYSFEDKTYLVVKATYYDNFYNDFLTPVLMNGVDIRSEFYSAVEEKLAAYASDATTTEDPELFLQPEETGIPKSVTHKGQDYTSAPAIDRWVETLTGLHENKKLPTFEDTMIFQLKQSTEVSKIELESVDLIKLLGSLPVFYALDYNYNIEDYDIFKNYIAFNEILDDIELQVFAEWRELDELSDREIQEQAAEYLSNGRVFGMFDINTDLIQIRRSIQPASLEAINNMYYNDIVVNRYTMLYEYPEIYELIGIFRDSTELELIKQVGKTYHIKMTAPDINALYTAGECWNKSRQEVYAYLTEKLVNNNFTSQTLYTEVILQKDSANKYGFAVITDYLDKLLTDGIYPQVLNHLGLNFLLSGKIENGFLSVDGETVTSLRFDSTSSLFTSDAPDAADAADAADAKSENQDTAIVTPQVRDGLQGS